VAGDLVLEGDPEAAGRLTDLVLALSPPGVLPGGNGTTA
jgi:hypothetical protein